MLYIALVLLGIILLIYAIFLCQKINNTVDKKILKKSYYFIMILISFFIFGYTVFLVHLLKTEEMYHKNDLLISYIFFFGGMFVVFVLQINSWLMKRLTKKTKNLKNLNKELKKNNKELFKKTEELRMSKEKLQTNTIELEKTLEDFYTIRLSLEKDMKNNVVQEENRKIKKRLDSLKNNK